MTARPHWRWLAALLLSVAVGAAACLWLFWNGPRRGLPYHSAFDQRRASEWIPFGGTWGVQGGTMRNSSDERGAKLVTGSQQWGDYTLEADLRFLGTGGDVGLLLRSSKEEAGVDAYDGYYVGLRSFDNSLVAGRADFGWSEARPAPLPAPIRPLAWYHIKVTAVGCRLAAVATDPATGQQSMVAMVEPGCVRTGRIGLRSMATGSEWRNVSVRTAGSQDILTLWKQTSAPERPLYPRTEAEYNTMNSFKSPAPPATTPLAEQISPIESLRFKAGQLEQVRGVVTLVKPELIVEEGGAGVLVHLAGHTAPTVNLGDEVEIEGTVGAQPAEGIAATALYNGKLRLLWDRSPVSPVSVTPLQATTEDFAGMLVETQGEVVSRHEEGGSIVLDLLSDDQRFRAIVDRPLGGLRIPDLRPHSIVRVRGVCLPDVRYTKKLTPFVLLMPSIDDLEVVSGPPWWTARRLMQWLVCSLLLLLLLQTYHGRMQRLRRNAITEERERLAHELHDTLAQSFAGVAFQLHGIRNRLRMRGRAELDLVEQQLDVATDFVRRTHQEASLSIAMLRSQAPEIGDLASSLERRAADLAAPGRVHILVTGDGRGQHVPLRITDAFFHVGLEAMVNAVRHSDAERITIRLHHDREQLTLEIDDDGTGFIRDPDCERLGLKGMERRAGMIHAQLQIRSFPGSGTRIKLTAPVGHRLWPWVLGRTA